jgi:AcrR family transcriptional regulator
MTAGAGDGRVARAERTRDRIVAAAMQLIDETGEAPTSRRIAQRAGIAERTLYLRFPDLESLHAAVADQHFGSVSDAHSTVDASLPLPERIHAFARRRARVLERMTPLRRVALRYEPGSAALQASHRRWTAAARSELLRTFARELDASDSPSAALSAAQAATSWATWDQLRSAQGLSPRAAVAAVELTLRGLLGGSSATQYGRRGGRPQQRRSVSRAAQR